MIFVFVCLVISVFVFLVINEFVLRQRQTGCVWMRTRSAAWRVLTQSGLLVTRHPTSSAAKEEAGSAEMSNKRRVKEHKSGQKNTKYLQAAKNMKNNTSLVFMPPCAQMVPKTRDGGAHGRSAQSEYRSKKAFIPFPPTHQSLTHPDFLPPFQNHPPLSSASTPATLSQSFVIGDFLRGPA